MIRSLALAALLTAALPVGARAYEAVTDEAAFLALIEGKNLSLRLFGVSLQVLPDGTILGEAQGAPITGTWTWEEGYFCREMLWGDEPIPYNCQLVEVRGDSRMRFTTDRGAGESAAFALR